MHQANSQHSASIFHLKALRQIERVVIAIPCEDALSTKRFGYGSRGMISDAKRKCGAALLKLLGRGNPIDARARYSFQAFDQHCDQLPLVGDCAAIGRRQRFPSRLNEWNVPPFQRASPCADRKTYMGSKPGNRNRALSRQSGREAHNVPHQQMSSRPPRAQAE